MVEIRETRQQSLPQWLAERFEQRGEREEERRKRAEAVREMRARKTREFKFLVNGTVGGAVGLALAGALIGSVELGEIWKEYGKNHFPLDPFTKRGRTAMRAEFRKMKDAFKRIG